MEGTLLEEFNPYHAHKLPGHTGIRRTHLHVLQPPGYFKWLNGYLESRVAGEDNNDSRRQKLWHKVLINERMHHQSANIHNRVIFQLSVNHWLIGVYKSQSARTNKSTQTSAEQECVLLSRNYCTTKPELQGIHISITES